MIVGYKFKHIMRFGAPLLRKSALALSALTMLSMSSNAFAANEPTAGQANIVQRLSLLNTADLDFGSFFPGATGGTVVINANTGNRATTGSVVTVGGGNNAAQFLTIGGPSTLLLVQRGPLPVLTRFGGTETMNVTGLTLNGPVFRFLGADGLLDLRVGGTLAVGANQAAGFYSGTFDIIVTYF